MARRTDGPKKTKKNLRENETIEYAETIEKSTKKNLMTIKRLIKRNLENRILITTGLKAWNRNHPNNKMTQEEYIGYRKHKEARRRKINEEKR